MAPRPPPERPSSRDLAPDDIRTAILMFQRRIDEVSAINTAQLPSRREPAVEALNATIEETYARVFGNGSVEYQRFCKPLKNHAPIFVGSPRPPAEIIEHWERAKEQTLAKLGATVKMLEERLELSGESPESKAKRALASLTLHEQIADAAVDLFKNGHYANAVEDACKALNALVQLKSKRGDLDGKDLMQTVFSKNKPILAFNDLQTESDRNEQEGMMYLFAGAMMALRNPRAHQIINDDPETTLEYIGLVNMLANRLGKTRRTS